MSDLVATRAVVDVPATTANLGAGFDTLALALDLRNRVEVEVADRDTLELEVVGEGAAELRPSRENRFLVALEAGLREARVADPAAYGWRVRMTNRIALGRGLGSSAAATIAGLVAARVLTGMSRDGEGALTDAVVLRLAGQAEGHLDNAAAALLGGFVVVADVDGAPQAVRFDPPRDLLAVVFIPERPSDTHAMRAVLPVSVPRQDAVHNVGRASLVVAAFATGRLGLLGPGTEDRLHEPYRAAAYPGLPMLVAAARDAGALGACLSGAGSSIVAFADSGSVARDVEAGLRSAARRAGLEGNVLVLRPSVEGARIAD